MAKFKSLNIGDTVRVVSLADTADRCGGTSSLNDYIGGTFEVTKLTRQPSTTLGQVQLSNGWWFSPKGLEVLTPTEPTVEAAPTGDEHGEFVTPETPVGTRVLYIGGEEDLSPAVGPEFILKRHDWDEYPRVDYTDGSDYEYIRYSNLRVATAQLGDEQGSFVTADTPVGTTVVYVGGDSESFAPIGVPLELKRHDGDSRPLVEVIDSTDPYDYYYSDYKYLRVHTGYTVPSTSEVDKEPTSNDFKYTRVRVKGTESEGVVVGRSGGSCYIAVLHDKTALLYHGGNNLEVDFVGVPNRIYYYQASELEIIGGVQ